MNIYENYIYTNPLKPGKFEYTHIDMCFLYEPFYVGKGQPSRWKFHVKQKRRVKMGSVAHKINTINKIKRSGFNPLDYVIRFNKGSSEDFAIREEVLLIKSIGRSNMHLGPLTNGTNGGEGHSGGIMSEEAIKKQKQTLRSNPDIVKQRVIKRKQTYASNPDIHREAVTKRKETMLHNPDIEVKKEIKRKQTEKNNPEIMEKRIRSHKATLWKKSRFFDIMCIDRGLIRQMVPYRTIRDLGYPASSLDSSIDKYIGQSNTSRLQLTKNGKSDMIGHYLIEVKHSLSVIPI